jgi:site-specific recombinase XerD
MVIAAPLMRVRVGQPTTIGGAVDFTQAWANYRTYLLVDSDLTHSSVAEYGSVLRRWNRHLERHGIRWDQAGRDDLDRFLARPAASGARRGQPLSVNRRRTDTIAIHGLYRHAVLTGLLERDPFALVRLPRRRPGSPRSFPLADLGRILTGARDDDRLYLLCLLGYGAGLRRAEMAALDLADLDRLPWPGRLRVVGKGSRERWVPLGEKVRRAIDRHLGDRANLTAGPLVANRIRPGEPLTPSTVGDLLANHIRSVGIPVGSAHWLRHSAATWALAAAEGGNLEDVREWLGHQDSRTTRVYVSRFKWNVARNVIAVLPDPEREV